MVDTRSFQARTEPFDSEVAPPGDKSLAHRALILSAMAEGTSSVANRPGGADVQSMQAATMALGVEHSGDRVISPGIEAWSTPQTALDCGNSGTAMRLLAGALAGSPVEASLIGDPSLMGRPMSRLVEPLNALGADVAVAESGVHTTADVRRLAAAGADAVLVGGALVTAPDVAAKVRELATGGQP